MILLDTNVVSELRKAAANRADPCVVAWDQSLDSRNYMLSVISVQEIETGVLLLARRDAAQATVLKNWLEHDILGTFANRILPFDLEAARICATLHVPNPREPHDAMIAATALVHGLTLATRNVRDFAGTGARLVDPWAYRVGTGSGPE